MTIEVTTLNDVLAALQGVDLPLVFETDEGAIGAGYHVTELKQVSIKSIDCGGNVDDWRETHVQLLDGQDGEHMRTGKFAAIADKSMSKLRHLGEEPVFFELGLKNKGLRRYQIDGLTQSANGVRVHLNEGRAMCKPAAAARTTVAVSCCGGGMVPSQPSAPSDCCA